MPLGKIVSRPRYGPTMEVGMWTDDNAILWACVVIAIVALLAV